MHYKLKLISILQIFLTTQFKTLLTSPWSYCHNHICRSPLSIRYFGLSFHPHFDLSHFEKIGKTHFLGTYWTRFYFVQQYCIPAVFLLRWHLRLLRYATILYGTCLQNTFPCYAVVITHSVVLRKQRGTQLKLWNWLVVRLSTGIEFWTFRIAIGYIWIKKG